MALTTSDSHTIGQSKPTDVQHEVLLAHVLFYAWPDVWGCTKSTIITMSSV